MRASPSHIRLMASRCNCCILHNASCKQKLIQPLPGSLLGMSGQTMWPSIILSWQLDRGSQLTQTQPLLFVRRQKWERAPEDAAAEMQSWQLKNGDLSSLFSSPSATSSCRMQARKFNKKTGVPRKTVEERERERQKKVMQRRDWAGLRFLRVVPPRNRAPPAKVFSSAHPAHLLLRLQRRSRSNFLYVLLFIINQPHVAMYSVQVWRCGDAHLSRSLSRPVPRPCVSVDPAPERPQPHQ